MARLRLKDCFRSVRKSTGKSLSKKAENYLLTQVAKDTPEGEDGRAQAKALVDFNLELIDQDIKAVKAAMDAEAKDAAEAQKAALALETQTAEQVAAEREKTRQKAAIAKKQAAPLKGGLKAEDTTPDMLDTTAGETPLFSQPVARKEPEKPAERTPEPPKEPVVAPEPAKPATSRTLAPVIPEGLDPVLANLGRSETTTVNNIATELSEYTEEERTALQGVLKTADNKPRTLAAALKQLQPRTGGRGSSYQREARQEGARRDAVDEQLDRDEGIVRSRQRSMRPTKVTREGIAQAAAEKMREIVGKFLPSAKKAWIGNSRQIKDAPFLRQDYVKTILKNQPGVSLEEASDMFDQWVKTLPGSKMEGFTLGGRQYMMIDNVGVTDKDVTDEMAARRVLLHEDAHIGTEAAKANPKLNREWKGIKTDISPEDLDSLAADRYPRMANWRDSKDVHDELAHEWLSEQAEIQETKGLPPSGIVKRFIEWMRKVYAYLTGDKAEEVPLSRVMAFIEAGRAARSRSHRQNTPLRPSMQEIIPPMDEQSPEDAAYLDAVERGDMETAQRMVDEAAIYDDTPRKDLVPDIPRGVIEPELRGLFAKVVAAERKIKYLDRGDSDRSTRQSTPQQTAAATRARRTFYAKYRELHPEDKYLEGAANQERAFSSISQPVTRDEQGNVIPLSQRFNPATPDIRFSVQPSYSSSSDERTEDYKEAEAAAPENGRNLVQFLGALTRTPRVTQAIRPMVDFARAKMGSYWGDELEITDENTERVKELAAQAFQKGKAGAQFAEDISQEFQDSGFSDNGRHQGSVMAGVMHMEIGEYAVRLAETGDKSLALAIMPYMNDVVRGDYFSLSNAGRALQLQSLAGQQKGFWTILNMLAKGERELAEKNPIYKELRAALFSDEVVSETVAGVQKDMESKEGQAAINPEIRPEDVLETYLPHAMSIMGEAEREITTRLFADMAELEILLAKQEAMQAPKVVKASMQAARGMNDPVAIQQRIDELKKSISSGLQALDKFKTSEASKETRAKKLSKLPKAKKALSADAEAKKMLDRLENKPKRTKKEPAPWKKTYTEQIQNPKPEAEFIDEMLKHGVTPKHGKALFAAAEKASAELSATAKAKGAQTVKGPPQGFSAWVGGASQDGIEDFVDLVTKNITETGFNEPGFRRALSDKFDKADLDLIDATVDRVKAELAEQAAATPKAPTPPDFDARAKKLATNAIAKKSGAEQAKLVDPMTVAIKDRMKGDIDDAALKGRLLKLGIDPETAFALGQKVKEDLRDKAQEDAKRQAKILAEKLAREAAMPSKTADQIIDELDAKQTQWVTKGKPLNPIRELAKKARRPPDLSQGPTTFPTWDDFKRQFIALGVNPVAAHSLTNRLKAENAKERANKVLRARESAANSVAFVNSVMKSIFEASLEEQANPSWRRQTMVNAFLKRGFTPTAAEKAADWLEYRFHTHLANAQEKAGRKAAKDLNMKKPTLEKLVKGIRSRGIDPLNADPVTKALAAEAGFAGITPEQFTELAKLDGQMRGPYQSLRAKAAARMLDIALAAKPPKSKADILTQAWISSALSSVSTMSLSALHAGFIPVRRLVTDFAGIALDVSTGKTKPADAAQMMVNTISNLQQSLKYMLDTARFAGANDAYTQHIVEFINQMHSMQADMQRAVQTLKDPKASGTDKGKAAIKLAFTSTDIVRRILSTADETWGSMLQDFILRNEAMRALVQKAKMTPTLAATYFAAASNIGRIAGEQHLNETGNEVEARLVERDATQNALLDAVRVHVNPEAAKDVEETSTLDSPMELGNRRSEESPLLDIPNTGLEWVKQLAIASRRKNELFGRAVTGFVTVPANILNRSAYFTPLGIIRALYKMGKFNSMPKFMKWLETDPATVKKMYDETMRTEGQQRMRLVEGIVGTLLISILIAFKPDDDEEGIVITGSGPEDRGLREAWLKKGNRPNTIQWRDAKGNVRWGVPYARGGFDHMNFAFTLVGTMDDMRIKGIKPKPANVEWGSQFLHTTLKGLFDQAKFFGLKNVAAMPTQMTDRSLASYGAYLASPVVPWAGLTKSLGRMWTGPTDQSSVRSAVLAQMPFTNFAGTQALNALGDQRGPAPTDAAWDRALMSGAPFTVNAQSKGKDEDLYTFMIDKGIAPNVPLRSTIERRNGFLTDEVWTQYLKTRGALIKQAMRKNLRRMKLLPHKDAQNLMERISGEATKATKAKLGLE